MKAGGQHQVGTALDCAQQLPSGRTSAPCDTATPASNLELRGLFQINNRQMSPTSQVGHGQSDALPASSTYSSGWASAPRAVVRASRARAMAWTAADRTRRRQCVGSGRGRWGCRAMRVLFKNLEKLSGQIGDNARERLDLPDVGAH